MEANVRIDKGIKRGPKKEPDPNRTSAGIPRTSVQRRRDPQTGIVQAIPPDLNPADVLKRYLSEETTSQIAKSYGVTRKSLTAWLREVAKDEWKKVQIIRALDMKDQGNDDMAVAADPLSLARAREMTKSAQWDLKALDEDFQDKQHLTVEHVGDLGDKLRRARERTIEGECVAEPTHAAPHMPVLEDKPES